MQTQPAHKWLYTIPTALSHTCTLDMHGAYSYTCTVYIFLGMWVCMVNAECIHLQVYMHSAHKHTLHALMQYSHTYWCMRSHYLHPATCKHTEAHGV